MRKIRLSNTDGALFDEEMVPQDFDYLARHKDTFCRMWTEQGRPFWRRYIEVFRSYILRYSLLGDLTGDGMQLQGTLEFAFTVITAQFIEGKANQAKALLNQIADLGRNRHRFHHLDSKSVTKDPFYTKETRDIFREFFGPASEKASYIKVYLLTPVYMKFGGSIVRCLARWREASEMDPDDDSYYVQPAPIDFNTHICTEHGPSAALSDATHLCAYHFDDCNQKFDLQYKQGHPTHPVHLSFWDTLNPRLCAPGNPLFDKSAHGDWRDGLTLEKFQAFYAWCSFNDKLVSPLNQCQDCKARRKAKKKSKKKKKKSAGSLADFGYDDASLGLDSEQSSGKNGSYAELKFKSQMRVCDKGCKHNKPGCKSFDEQHEQPLDATIRAKSNCVVTDQATNTSFSVTRNSILADMKRAQVEAIKKSFVFEFDDRCTNEIDCSCSFCQSDTDLSNFDSDESLDQPLRSALLAQKKGVARKKNADKPEPKKATNKRKSSGDLDQVYFVEGEQAIIKLAGKQDGVSKSEQNKTIGQNLDKACAVTSDKKSKIETILKQLDELDFGQPEPQKSASKTDKKGKEAQASNSESKKTAGANPKKATVAKTESKKSASKKLTEIKPETLAVLKGNADMEGVESILGNIAMVERKKEMVKIPVPGGADWMAQFEVVCKSDSINGFYDRSVTLVEMSSTHVPGSQPAVSERSKGPSRLLGKGPFPLLTPHYLCQVIPNLPVTECMEVADMCLAVVDYTGREECPPGREDLKPTHFCIKIARCTRVEIMKALLIELLRYVERRKRRPSPGWTMTEDDIFAFLQTLGSDNVLVKGIVFNITLSKSVCAVSANGGPPSVVMWEVDVDNDDSESDDAEGKGSFGDHTYAPIPATTATKSLQAHPGKPKKKKDKEKSKGKAEAKAEKAGVSAGKVKDSDKTTTNKAQENSSAITGSSLNQSAAVPLTTAVASSRSDNASASVDAKAASDQAQENHQLSGKKGGRDLLAEVDGLMCEITGLYSDSSTSAARSSEEVRPDPKEKNQVKPNEWKDLSPQLDATMCCLDFKMKELASQAENHELSLQGICGSFQASLLSNTEKMEKILAEAVAEKRKERDELVAVQDEEALIQRICTMSKAAGAEASTAEPKSEVQGLGSGGGDAGQKSQRKARGLVTCSYCSAKEPSLHSFKKCARCVRDKVTPIRYYCGRECQVAHWKSKHQEEHDSGTLKPKAATVESPEHA